jgi:GNAT superfamily N-acetyltransferase
MPIQIERLHKGHVRERFECGEPSLNNYIQRFALQNDERRVGRTFVAVESGDPRVLGYYTLATGKVSFENLPNNKKLPPHMPIPVVLLGRLAVDDSSKGTGLGKYLLLHALWRSQRIAQDAGVFAVEVDALHEKAAQFYLKYGFTPLLDNPLHLYLSMKDIEALHLDLADTDE